MSDVLCSTKYIQLKSTPSKSGNPWVYAHRPNAKDVVVILPIYKDELLFLIEERPPMKAEGKPQFTIAIPAGLVGDEREGETLEDAIRAELLEESGLAAKKIEVKTNCIASSPGCTSETCAIAFAYIENRVEVQKPVTDGGVILERIWVKKSEVHMWFKEMEAKGYALTGQTLAALFYLYEGV